MSTLATRTAPPRRPGYACSVATLLGQLPKAEAAALRGMLADPAWTQDAIWAACTDEGLTVGRQTIGRHRRGTCRCSARV